MFDDISPNMHHKDEKSVKFCLFKMINLTKIAFFGPYFAHFPLFPADMLIFWVKAVDAISFAPKKVVRTWSETQKVSFFTNISSTEM